MKAKDITIGFVILAVCAVSVEGLTQYSDSVTGRIQESTATDTTILPIGVQRIDRQFLGRLSFRGESQEYFALFPGTVMQDYQGEDLLHVRGSRHDEIAYIIESIDVRSAYTGLSMFRIMPEALESIALHTSPSASKSHASALFERRLRRGGRDFKFSFQGESDCFTPMYEERLGTFSYGYWDAVVLSEGKIIMDNIRFFAAGEWQRFGDHYRKFWDGFTIGPPEFEMTDMYNGTTLEEFAGTDRIVIRPGNIPHATSERISFNGVVTADFSPLLFTAIGFYDRKKQQINDTPIRDVFVTRRIPVVEEHAGLLSLQADYRPESDFSAHLQFDVLRSGNKTYDPLFGDDFLLYRDSLAVTAQGLPWGQPPDEFGTGYYSDPPDYFQASFYFSSPGALLAPYRKRSEDYWAISGSVKEVWNNHHFHFGGKYQQHKLRYYYLKCLANFMKVFREFDVRPEEIDNEQMNDLYSSGAVRAYGYDLLGNPVDKSSVVADGPRHPSHFSLFLEDHYRDEHVSLVVGLRYDVFANDAFYLNRPDEVWYYDLEFNESWLETSPHGFLSPRLHLAYRVNDRITPYFSYGQYVQQVRLKDAYVSRAYYESSAFSWWGYDIKGPTAEPVRVTQTELGFKYDAGPRIRFESALFYKKTDGHLQTGRIPSPEPDGYSYLTLENSGVATAKGLELSLEYRHRGFYSWLNYTLSDVTGFTTYTKSKAWVFDYGESASLYYNPPKPLEYNQRHRINALAGFRFGREAPGWLRYVGFHSLFRFNSGHDFTMYVGRNGMFEFPSEGRLRITGGPELGRITTPWHYQFDVRIDKSFQIGVIRLTAYLYIQNIFNRKNVQHVYPTTGDVQNDGSFDITSPWSSWVPEREWAEELFSLYDLINYGHRQHYQFEYGSDLFGHPREIRFGLRVGF